MLRYISASDEGRQNGAIEPALSPSLLLNSFPIKIISILVFAMKTKGRSLNLGLLDWKEGFGASPMRIVSMDVDPSKYTLIDKALQTTTLTEKRLITNEHSFFIFAP